MMMLVKIVSGKAGAGGRNAPPRPSFRTWAFHWMAAVLALFLAVTSVPSAFTLWKRPFLADWMNLHLSAGIALLVITLVRIGMMLPFGKMRDSLPSSWKGAAALKYWLLLTALATTLTGLPIYQKPPLGKSSYLFSLIPMPTIARLDHGPHNLVINIHIALSSLLLFLIAAHVVAGLRRSQRGAKLPLAMMLWPWSGSADGK